VLFSTPIFKSEMAPITMRPLRGDLALPVEGLFQLLVGAVLAKAGAISTFNRGQFRKLGGYLAFRGVNLAPICCHNEPQKALIWLANRSCFGY
jgi:hypothetical protein